MNLRSIGKVKLGSSGPRGLSLGLSRYCLRLILAGALAGIMLLGGPVLPPGETSAAGDETAVYRVDTSALLKLHPLWGELQAVLRDIDTCEAEWRAYIDSTDLRKAYIGAFYVRLGDRLKSERDAIVTLDGDSSADQGEMLNRQLSEFEKAVWEDIGRRLREKAKELEGRVEDQLYMERGLSNQELESYKQEVQKSYLPSILNLQLKLSLLDLSDSERQKLKSEIARLKSEMEVKIIEREKALDQEFSKIAQKKRDDADGELARYRESLLAEGENTVREERARLLSGFNARAGDVENLVGLDVRGAQAASDAQAQINDLIDRLSLESRSTESDMIADFAKKKESFEVKLGELEGRKARLTSEMEADVRSLVKIYAKMNGIQILIEPDQGHDAGDIISDITPAVAGFARRYFSQGGGAKGTWK